MQKIIIISSLIIIFLSSCTSNDTKTIIDNTNINNTYIQPDRKMDLYGKIVGIEANEISLLQVDTSKDPTFNMSPEEKKKYMQSLDEAARTALKEEINSATLGEVKLTIPVGIAMTKKETSGPDAPSLEASLADLKAGGYISVWLDTNVNDRKVAEFVKVAFVQ